jgi:hypothetical protein
MLCVLRKDVRLPDHARQLLELPGARDGTPTLLFRDPFISPLVTGRGGSQACPSSPLPTPGRGLGEARKPVTGSENYPKRRLALTAPFKMVT